MSSWQQEMVEALSAAKPAERRAVLDRFARRTGYSRQHLYRLAKRHGFSSGRKKRSDRGKLRCELTEDQVDFVAALIHSTSREVKGPIMPVETALEIAADNGIIEPGQVSVGRMQQILRERQVSRKALKNAEPCVPLRSLHPNHCHVFDVSVCIQYYLKGSGMKIMDERNFYKNKPHNFAKVKTRLLRYVIADHFSGAFYFRYFNTSGETRENLYEFLVEAWKKKDDPKYPFRGVPDTMMMDAGSANISGIMLGFLERLGVDVPKGDPHNPQRQGAVEVLHNVIESHFESGLRLQPAHSLDELNAWAYDFCVGFNARKKHSRHGMTRSQCWLMIRPEQLRELPEEDLLRELYVEPEATRVVSKAYTISFRGEEYRLKHIGGIHPNAIVRVRLKPFDWPEIDVVFGDATYTVGPIEKLPAELGGFRADAAVIGQEYKAQPETLTQKAKKRFENMAYGEEKKKDAVPFEGLKVFGHQAEKVRHTFIERRGTPIELDRSIAAREISFAEFLRRLVREAGPISRELNQALRTRYGSSIEISEVEEVIRQIQEGRWSGSADGGRQAEAL